MLFGLRNQSEIYHQAFLDSLAKKYPNFSYEYVLSAVDNKDPRIWLGKTGYVQTHLGEFNVAKTPSTVYLCGNGNMIKEAKAILLGREGLDPSRVLSEAFD